MSTSSQNFHLKTINWLAILLDEQYTIGKFKFGLDPLLDFIPIIGDLIGFALSAYIVFVAVEMKVPGNKVSEMVGNIVFDFILGLFPVVGMAADFFFKANIKNIKIIKEYLPVEIVEGEVIR